MKKIYSTFMMLAMMVAALSFTACGSDDDENENGSSALIGTWEIVQSVHYYGNESEVENDNGAYWEFTANKLTVHDSTDSMNGKPSDYTYSNGKLNIIGMSFYMVTELTSEKMVLRSEPIDLGIYTYHNIITFKKR